MAHTAPLATADLTITEFVARYREFACVCSTKNGEPTGETAPIKMVVGRMRQLRGEQPADEFSPLAGKACSGKT